MRLDHTHNLLRITSYNVCYTKLLRSLNERRDVIIVSSVSCIYALGDPEAGLAIAAYGSYYRVEHDDPAPFEPVLATAVELGAPTVRVWAGSYNFV